MKKIAFLGFGLRSKTMLAAMRKMELEIQVGAIADPMAQTIQHSADMSAVLCECDPPQWYSKSEDLLQKEHPDGIFIGTRCALHTPLAIQALRLGIPVLLEKPVCTSHEQLAQLATQLGQNNGILVSFPLRFTAVVGLVKAIVSRGDIGQVTMVQAINNVPYGSVYFNSWYRNPSETGGLFLQKATHDIDYICHIIGEVPVNTAAFASKLHYKGSNPANMRCQSCAQYRTCSESPYVVKHILREEPTGDACCFAEDTGNEDGASVVFQTKSGINISYSHNFIVKKTAGRRGARFIGTKGSVEFDFYTGIVRQDSYALGQTTEHKVSLPTTTHWGGDEGLALAFMQLLNGGASAADLRAGLNSAACCLAAKKSAETGRFVKIAPYLSN